MNGQNFLAVPFQGIAGPLECFQTHIVAIYVPEIVSNDQRQHSGCKLGSMEEEATHNHQLYDTRASGSETASRNHMKYSDW
jgi:hypothetical protein